MKCFGYLRVLLLLHACVGVIFGQTNSPGPPISGESWLMHLQRTFDETSMGKTGRLGPATFADDQNIGGLGEPSRTAGLHVSLSGADLYRLNCRACHGEAGTGAPPEINSVINPVRSGSVTAVMARMKSVGMDMSRAEASKLAEQSRAAIVDRLHNGGKDMPAFAHLSPAEVLLLLGYLNELAEVPGAPRAHGSLESSRLRAGELIARSTCHICHAAAGKNPTPQELSEGAIPPLSSLTTRTTRNEFIRKVTRGAPVTMGSPQIVYRGRMPVFSYFSAEEAGDVYEYLEAYPPREQATAPLTIALWQHPASSNEPPSGAAASLAGSRPPARAGESTVRESPILLPVAGLLVLLLVGGGLGFTIYEMTKLAADSKPDVASHEVRVDVPATPAASLQRGWWHEA